MAKRKDPNNAVTEYFEKVSLDVARVVLGIVTGIVKRREGPTEPVKRGRKPKSVEREDIMLGQIGV